MPSADKSTPAGDRPDKGTGPSRFGDEFFVVDDGFSGWTGLRNFEEWTEIAKACAIATGHFEIGALLALDGWRGPRTIRTGLARALGGIPSACVVPRRIGQPLAAGLSGGTSA